LPGAKEESTSTAPEQSCLHYVSTGIHFDQGHCVEIGM
jgi:hypothetical protein